MVCMIDNDGRTVAEWLPHMQSSDFLRASISKGERTAECWAELSKRTTRVRAALEILNDNRLQSASSQPENAPVVRSEEHTSELQSLMRISYAVFCLKKKTKKTRHKQHTIYIQFLL